MPQQQSFAPQQFELTLQLAVPESIAGVPDGSAVAHAEYSGLLPADTLDETPSGTVPELQENSVFHRLGQFQQITGFYPTSRRELSEGLSLLSTRSDPGNQEGRRTYGAAGHLAKIASHQIRYGADPDRTALALTMEYGGYARRARTDRTALMQLETELPATRGVSALEKLASGQVHTGRGQVVRYIDLSRLATGQDASEFPFPPLRVHSEGANTAYDRYITTQPTGIVAAHIAVVIEGIKIWQAHRIVSGAIEDQKNRQRFWTERLEKIAVHDTGSARLAAQYYLEQMGVYPDNA